MDKVYSVIINQFKNGFNCRVCTPNDYVPNGSLVARIAARSKDDAAKRVTDLFINRIRDIQAK